MSPATKLQNVQWRAIEAVNALVECDDASMEDRYAAIRHVLRTSRRVLSRCSTQACTGMDAALGPTRRSSKRSGRRGEARSAARDRPWS